MQKQIASDKPEAVGVFADHGQFTKAIEALMNAGFDRTELSILASHDSLDAAGKPGRSWRDVVPALIGEIKYEGPLVASGAVILAGGPMAATLAAAVGAAVSGFAVKELLEEVSATPHTEEFARALEAGSLILWVQAADDKRREEALALLRQYGARNVHVVQRSTGALAGA